MPKAVVKEAFMKNRLGFVMVIIQVVGLISMILSLIPSINKADWDTFIFLCVLGTIICVSLTLVLCILQKRIFTVMILTFVSFWGFQFGLPIVYVFVENYSNFYIGLFSNQVLINGAIYSIWAIQAFAIALTLGVLLKSKANRGKQSQWFLCLEDDTCVSKAALILFVMTGLVSVPLMIYSAYATVTMGFWEAETRTFLSSNAIFRMAQAFCVPAGLLYICYNNKSKGSFVISVVIVAMCVCQMIAGDRTNGLVGILALAFYYIFNSKGDTNSGRKELVKQMIFGGSLVIILLLLVYIAKARVSTEMVSFVDVISNGVIKKFLSEIGFNFTTICFIMQYIPGTKGFQYGLSYFTSFLCLIPKSLDPTGTIEKMYSGLGELWLHQANHVQYDGLLDFGVGYSIIGESYYDFGWFGIIAVFLIGLLVAWLISKEFGKCSNWERYIQVVLILSLMTFARRGFYDLLKDIEYSIVFIAVYIWVFQKIYYKWQGRHKKVEK